jgi:hypothetical protein
MRCSLIACAVALVTAGCTPELCARSSDCTTGQVCGVTGQCAIPADASTDAQDAGSIAVGDARASSSDARSGGGKPDAVIPEIADDPRPR